MSRAAIYTRISRDFTGAGAGVARQEQDCREKATSLGWEVAEVYSDNDASAYSGKRRPQYESMLGAIRAGQVDGVIVWHTDRLYRRMTDLEEYISVCGGERRGIPTYTVKAEGSLDLTTPSGRMVARQLASVAQYESEQKGERQRRANRQRAEQGRHFGTRRPFGYEPDGLTVREAEAEAIRDAYRLILSGGSLREVARRWNDAGLVTPQKGSQWTGTVVGRTLRTARLAGVREYLGEVVRGSEGEAVASEWPAIVDLDTWQAAQAVLDDPARRTTPTFTSQLLLSGVALCADCGAVIQSGGKRKGRSRYRCSGKAGHVYREAKPVDDFVEELVLRRLAEPDLVELVRGRSEGPRVDVAALRRGAAEVHARMDGLAEAYADGDITKSQLQRGSERATARLAEIEGQMPTDTGTAALGQLVTGLDLLRTWAGLSLEQRRGVVDALVTVRLVAPRAAGLKAYAPGFGPRMINPATLIIEWK